MLNNIGNGESLASAGGAEQHLVTVTLLDTCQQLFDCLRLISGGFVRSVKFELHRMILHALRFVCCEKFKAAV